MAYDGSMGHNAVYLACGSSLFAFDADSGDELWSVKAAAVIASTPAVDKSSVLYFGDNAGFVYAVDAASGGAPVWSYLLGGSVASSPAISADGAIVVGCRCVLGYGCWW